MDELTRKYIERIKQNMSGSHAGEPQVTTRQYEQFKEQYLPKRLTLYEKACNLSAKVASISPNSKDRAKIEEAIRVCHLETTPEGVTSFSMLAPILFIISVAFLGYVVPVLLTGDFGAGSLFILLFGVIAGMSMIVPLQRLPFYFANNWRMKASNQMVLCTFYVVTYMRHTSNLELAIDFAGDHLAPPLSIDMKKVIWDVETEKYESIKESLDSYLDTWKEWNPEFIESMHLIQGSLLESSEARRVELLDKSLSIILDETYEKMLHYAHNLKSPLTTLHMLGVILPILGLVILPLLAGFMPEVRWYHVAIIYNVTLPVLVYVIAKSILSTRPTGYGNADMTDINPELKKQQNIRIPLGGKDEILITPVLLSAVIIVAMLTVGLFPFVYHIASPEKDWVMLDGVPTEVSTANPEEYEGAKFFFLDYRPADPNDPESERIGPFGIGATLLSLFIPLAFGIGIGSYYAIRSKRIMKVREETRKLEAEFASALFQLGNRLADGIPAEIAFAKVADVLQGTNTGKFFDTVVVNISKMGMSIEEAIFDPKHGAILDYPSPIIESSMKVLVESNKKGPLVASQALINVSEYIKQMHRVDERLRDLMSDVISSMKSQVNFLTPVIAGIVIGITSMIMNILGSIATKFGQLQGSIGDAGASNFSTIFGVPHISTYFFQAVVGLYVVQITYILTIMVNGIENGIDETAEQDSLGKNMIRATLLYIIISAVTIILFSIISSRIGDI